MPIQFAREPLTDALWSEAMPLLQAHWAEVAHFTDIKLEPDRERYANLEENGVLACFTARDVAVISLNGIDRYERSRKPLVGYALYLVAPNAHYKSSLQATQDVIYLDPSVRGGTGYKFIAWCDQQLAEQGVVAVYQHVKERHNFGKLLERQGYELVDLIYAKRLDARTEFDEIEGLVTAYREAWQHQAYSDADVIAARIVGLGFSIEHTPNGIKWRRAMAEV